MQFSEFAQEVLNLTNDFRQQNGLAPLTMNEELVATAQKYSQTMAEDDFFSHTGEDGSAPWDRAEDEGYTARTMAENIAAGYSTPEQVVQGWIDSSGHRRNMLNANFTELGVGYFELENDTGQVNYNHYWTQLFGSGDLTPDSPATPVPTPAPTPEPTPEPALAPVPEPVDDAVPMDDASFTQAVLRLTNEFRAENGLEPLTMNEELATTAQKYSQAMAEGDFFSHTGLNGSKPWDRAEQEGYTARAMGENIAAGQRTPEQVVQGWIDSPGHRRNMLNPSYTELGVGYFELEDDTGNVNYNRYWTQLFGSGDLTPDSAAPVAEADEVDESIFEPVSEAGPDTVDTAASDGTPTAPERVIEPEPDFVGDNNNNKINGNRQNNTILGLAGNDRIKARQGDDFVDGGAGNDRLWGSLGSDILIGGLDNDILVGSGYFGAGKGLNDMDILTGDEGADRFVLGNRRHAFYALNGAEDYALITDLTVAEGDTIRLNNQFSYSLGAAPEGTADGQGLFIETNNGSDLIAVIQGAEGLALTDSTFVYV